MPLLSIGDLRIDCVEEFCGPTVDIGSFLTGLPEDAVERNLDWLVPTYLEAGTRRMVVSVLSWVVRTQRHTILIDTCFGNFKALPDFGGNWDTPWLERLGALGLRPEDIDYVMCTHMHADHVGWNTRLIDGRWVPTFPNARYLFGRREHEHWSKAPRSDGGADVGYRDGVLPCIEAGLAEFVDDGYEIGRELVAVDAPGHTPGHMVVRARSRDQGGIFLGDALHAPLQIRYPHVNSVVCDDPALAHRTRVSLLEECAEHGHYVMPAHFPKPYFGRVTRDGNGFAFRSGAT